MTNDGRLLRVVILRLTAAWLLLSLGLLAFGPATFEALLPVLKFVIDLLQPDLDATLRLALKAGDWNIEMEPLVVHPIRLARGRYLASGTHLGVWSTDLSHNLLPLALFLSAVLAWPVRRRLESMWRLALSTPVLLLLLVLSAPIVLAGQLEISIVRQAARLGVPTQEPGLVTFLVFMESGGCWLLPIAAAIGCIAGGRRWAEGATPSPPEPEERETTLAPPVFPPV